MGALGVQGENLEEKRYLVCSLYKKALRFQILSNIALLQH